MSVTIISRSSSDQRFVFGDEDMKCFHETQPQQLQEMNLDLGGGGGGGGRR